jgi:hypothetical protein
MVIIIIDGIQYSGKSVTIKNWGGYSKNGLTHYYSETYDGADKLAKLK